MSNIGIKHGDQFAPSKYWHFGRPNPGTTRSSHQRDERRKGRLRNPYAAGFNYSSLPRDDRDGGPSSLVPPYRGTSRDDGRAFSPLCGGDENDHRQERHMKAEAIQSEVTA